MHTISSIYISLNPQNSDPSVPVRPWRSWWSVLSRGCPRCPCYSMICSNTQRSSVLNKGKLRVFFQKCCYSITRECLHFLVRLENPNWDYLVLKCSWILSRRVSLKIVYLIVLCMLFTVYIRVNNVFVINGFNLDFLKSSLPIEILTLLSNRPNNMR